MRWKPYAVLAGCLLAVALLASVVPLPAADVLALGPGHEAAIEALALPYRDGAAVGEGVILSGIAVSADRVEFVLRSVPDGSGLLILRPPERAGQEMAIEVPMPDNAALVRAQVLLAAAIAQRDDGALSRSLAQPERSQLFPLLGLRATLAAWLLVLFASVARGVRLLRDLRRPRQWLAVVALLLGVLAAAVLARAEAPLTPLRPNGHAYEDFAIALSLPETAAEHRQTATSVGDAWLEAQRALVPLFGRHHDGVGWLAIAAGSLASLLAAGAVFAASGSAPAAALAGLVMALAPAAVRVGHSESPLVFAQLLIAAVLWLAGPRATPLQRCGTLCALLLLALGHVMGAALAGSALLLAWALAWHPREKAHEPPPHLTPRKLAPWLGLLALVGLAGLWQASRYAASKAGDVQGGIVMWDALRVWRPLWWRLDFGAPLAVLAALAGALAWVRAQPSRPLQLRLTLVLGAAALAALLPMAPLARGDASQLRYEAALGPLLALLFAPLPLLVPTNGRLRTPARVGMGALALALLLTLLLADAGRRQLDSQGQSYQELRQVLGRQPGTWSMLVPPAQQRAVRMVAPIGRWSAQGPTLRTLEQGALDAACREGQPIDANAVLLLDGTCAATPAPGLLPAPCRDLAAYVDPQRILARRELTVPGGGGGEFHFFPRLRYVWQLSGVRCRR